MNRDPGVAPAGAVHCDICDGWHRGDYHRLDHHKHSQLAVVFAQPPAAEPAQPPAGEPAQPPARPVVLSQEFVTKVTSAANDDSPTVVGPPDAVAKLAKRNKIDEAEPGIIAAGGAAPKVAK